MSGLFGRKFSLIVFSGEKGLDLSQFHVRFHIRNADVESPNNCTIRVYNLSQSTVKQIKGEFSQVVLNAGYENGNYGVVFQGQIKQFRIGRENATDTYLDILAADGDIGYNQGIVNTTLAAGHTPSDIMATGASAMGMQVDSDALVIDKQHTPSIRGAVLFGMARAKLRDVSSTLNASWSIQNGKVVVISNTGYVQNEVVKLNVATGLIGLPEQTDGGIKLQCLLNSRLRIGGLVQINNEDIIQLMQQNPNTAPIAFDQWASFQFNAPLSPDGYYRMYVVEHEGDTRGNIWQSNLVCLAAKISSPVTQSVSPS